MNHLSLFSGIGGIDLAAEWAGIGTAAFCEVNPFCQRVLRKNFGKDIVLFDDIKSLTRKSLDEKDVGAITIITGGFPCQPFSAAGRKAGAADDRHLWPEMFRLIRECKPTWVVGENVAGILNMVEFEDACLDLEKENYEVQPLVIPACGVGAPHKRERVFILAYSENNAAKHRLSVADAIDSGLQGGQRRSAFQDGKALAHGTAPKRHRDTSWPEDWPEAASRLCVVDDGLSERVAKLQAAGNAVVPQQIFPILYEIAQIEGIVAQ